MSTVLHKLTDGQDELGRILDSIDAADSVLLKQLVSAFSGVVQSGSVHLDSGRLPLQLAAQKGSIEMCRELLSAGAPLEKRDGHGLTPLQVHDSGIFCLLLK